MFQKHSMLVKYVKDNPTQDQIEPVQHLTPDDFSPLAREIITSVAGGAIVLTGVYVAADTIRRCLVHIVATKIN